MVKLTTLFLFLFLLFGCSSGGQKERDQLRNAFLKKEYENALELLKNSKFYKKDESRLLKSLETGLILHQKGNLEESVIEFQNSKEIYRALYTESLTKKAKTLIANDNYDIYYGQAYERSLVNFYNSLNYFLLYQKSKDNKFLFKSRAEILDWDSFQNMRIEAERGNSVFKQDLLSKIFGASIHEEIGTVNELQVALQLYKDAKDTLFKYYNAYETFNLKSKEFKKDFSKLHKIKKDKIEKEYISKTHFQNELIEFLDQQILRLSKKIRPKEFRRLTKNKKINIEEPNITLIVQQGIIPEKMAKKEYYNLERALSLNSDSPAAKAFARLGSQVLMIFAADKLGLIPPPSHYNPVGTHLGIQLAAMSAEGLAISFEIPSVNKNSKVVSKRIVLKNDKDEVVKEAKAYLINPYSDISEEAVAENAVARYLRLGARLATKHLGAIVAAYGTYQATKPSMGEGMAKLTALAQYAATIEVIRKSEKADTRFWSTPPAEISLAKFKLAPGKYKSFLEYLDDEQKVIRSVILGEISLSEETKNQLYNFRSL